MSHYSGITNRAITRDRLELPGDTRTRRIFNLNSNDPNPNNPKEK